ncbi:NAD(P)/FAD-dependent oxidoreductase [Streptomyces sp. NPDC051561]|uniref:NAD(P)/FAD-dependent oxidoreductase n=1 Tax=Streptomyces sp. NPDC051561 TaxID=3365658 RepID=UPI0037966992
MTEAVTSADVVIVGGGIIGMATAERLTARGLTVEMVDECAAAEGATSISGGLVRAFDPSGDHPAWAAEGLDLYRRRGWHGTWPELREHGSLTLFAAHELARATTHVDVLQAAGRTADILTPQQITTRFPGLSVPDGLHGAYEPQAGWLPADQVRNAIRQDAGSALRVRRARARSLLLSCKGIVGVDTSTGTVLAEAVLLAAGVGSAALAKAVGIHLPLRTRSVSYGLFRVEDHTDISQLPTVVDRTTGAWLRRWDERGTVLAGVFSPVTDVPETVTHGVPVHEEQRIRSALRDRYPHLAKASVVGGVTAYDAMAATGGGEVTQWQNPRGLVSATGWNGSGFKLAPAIGRFTASRIVEVLT